MRSSMRALFVLLIGCADTSASCPDESSTPANVGIVSGLPPELSGLAASHTVPDLLWAHADGSANDIYSIDATSAALHGSLHLAGAPTIDWEDIATAPCATGHCIFVADTGDNDLSRDTVAIFEITEPASNPVGAIDVDYRRYEVRFSDGAHDIEALFVDPRDSAAYGIAKIDGPAPVYRLPRVAGQVALAERVAMLDLSSRQIAAADLTVDACGVRLAVRTSDHVYELRGSPSASIADLVAADPDRQTSPDEMQGEGIAYAADSATLFLISEAASPPLWRVDRQ